jgi:CubicO group peptidase (beta-lactamase class C family)
LARGYGLANVKTQEPVSLDTLFSTASVTKTITATAVLRLVDQGKLSLDDSVYALLDKPRLLGGATLDPQVEKITVRQLLLHAAGWDSRIQGDFLRQTQKMARLTGGKLPVPADVVTRYGLSRPLDFAPGSESRYSNFGYFLAKQIVEHTAKQPYETYVRQQVLQPLGITDMRLEQRAPAYSAGEARRYRSDGQELPGGREPIAAPAGNWLATVVDLARFVSAISGDRNPPLLSAAARQEMFAIPPLPLSTRKRGSHVGLGWDAVREGPQGLEFHKNGSMAGVRAYVEHCGKDVDWVLLLNSDGTPDEGKGALPQMVEQIRRAIDSAREWPDRDLF